MSVKEIIDKIKLFLTEESSPKVEQQFTDVKTTDGVILSYDGELAVGVEIFVVDEAGKNPAPDGDYMLEDGIKITVVEGKVESFGQETPIETPEEMPAAPEGMSLEDLACKVKKLEEDNLQLAEIVAQLAESFSKQNFKEEIKMSMKEKIIETHDAPMNKVNELSSIFRNMYK